MTAHTPGPWVYERRGDKFVVGKRGEGAFIRIDEFSPEIDEADARLIAAAPDLLEALERAVAEFEQWMPRSLGYEFTHLPKMRAAIAKARGGQS